MDFIDIPILEAIDYFQGVLVYFFNFALLYGNFFGLLGIVWTSIKLVNSRINMRDAWWSMLSKWFVFVLLLNFYVAGTNAISAISNEIGINAGSGKQTIINNFVSLKSRIEKQLNLQKQWEKGLKQLENKELEITMNSLSTKKEIKEAKKRTEEYKKNKPEIEQSVWGQKTLNALNAVLIMRTSDGKRSENITGAYVVDKPEVNIWLNKKSRDEKGNEVQNPTAYLSGAAIIRIFILSGQIIHEKSRMEIIEQPGDNGEKEYKVQRRKGVSITNLDMDYLADCILADVLMCVLVASGAFCVIQYVMCILEYIIVQGIGAAFIPLYLFDGTKDIPKKLISVFTGFVIKIIVITICMMFVINLNLQYAAQQISPSSGSMSLPVFAEGLFIILLSFVLTSNAPKIAMTLLTGQPQLSMGELVAAAGTLAGGIAGAKNLAGSAVSPLKQIAQRKAHEWGEQNAANKAGKRKQKESQISDYASSHGIDTSTRAGQKQAKQGYKEFKNKKDENGNFINKDSINEQIKTAGLNAKKEVKNQQKENFKKHGGVLGESARMLAHYAGGFNPVNLLQTAKQGRRYNTPIDNVDIERLSGQGLSKFNPQTENTIPPQNDNTKTEEKKNNLPDDPNIGAREVE